MEKFKVGDVVQLKSGGPKMTVKSMNDEGSMYCQWFAGSKLQVGWFEAHSVTKVEE